MRTVNELKKLPASDLSAAIHRDIISRRIARQKELNADYLERHPDVKIVPDFITEDSETLAIHFTLGCLQALLRIAIMDLQQAEIALEHVEDELKSMLKMKH